MADAHAELIRQAVLQAREGHAQEALGLLLGSPVPETSASSSHYHLTLGSLLLQLERPGEAFAHLDAALHREGRSKIVEDLWKRAREQAEAKLGEGSLERASSPLESWVDHPLFMPVEALLAVGAAAASLQYIRKKGSPASRRVIFRWAAGCWVLATLACSIHFWGSRFERCRATTGIILRSGPSEDFIELGRVDPGAELRLLARQEQWVRVRVTSETSGWAPASGVLLLNPPSTTREP
jgi:hypothetical protein